MSVPFPEADRPANASERKASDLLPGPPPTVTLSGERLEQYLEILDRLLEAGRLNRFFPDPSEVRALYRFLRPSCNEGTYPTADIDLRSGLPAETEVSRVLTDVDVARLSIKNTSLEALETEVATNGSDAAQRRLSRDRYHLALTQVSLPCPFGLGLALRRVEPSARTAHFTVTFDRFDIGDGVFVRYTILLAQIDSRWTRPQVELVGDDLKYTENFRNVISRFTVDEAEFAFLLLSDLKGVRVEDVMRCRVGPLYFRGMHLPAPWDDLFDKHPGGFLLHFPFERAGRTVSQDGSNDPMGMLYRDYLSPLAREGVEPRVQQLGYKVWKERKFACNRELSEAVSGLLSSRGFRCLIQAV